MPLSEYERFISNVFAGAPVALLVSSQNCKPCEAAKQKFEMVATVLSDSADFHIIDITELPTSFVQSRSLRSAPTLLMYRGGLEEDRLTGDDTGKFGAKMSGFVGEYLAGLVEMEDIGCESCQ